MKFVATKKIRQLSFPLLFSCCCWIRDWMKIRIRTTNIDMPHILICWLLFVRKCKYTVKYSRDRSIQILYCNMKHTHVEESGVSNYDIIIRRYIALDIRCHICLLYVNR